ncbi:flavin-containing monooxygenase [Aspergillus lucknowensis]|uniref:Cyclohexanone monooxygenase n=1 Tax=Aspergillus lucknowensis TaxID=176173 RepID=A0ABR4LCF6_9EURO
MGSIENLRPAERYHSQPRPLRIVHVGAGPAGLVTAYKARKMVPHCEMVVYEKNAAVGGTWFENKYPGIGCDVPSHSYNFTFEPNPEWNGYYAYGGQIQEYFVNFAKKYGLERYIRFESTVVGATWMDEDGEWELQIRRKDGTTFLDRCHVLINGSGLLNKWRWPDIKGRETFKGVMTHTANWDPAIEWKDKRVAVIGVGSSGVQVIPELVKGSSSLTVFIRSTQWIVPPAAIQDLRVFPDDPERSAQPAPAGKHSYTEDEKILFRSDPERFLQYRKAVDGVMQERFPIFLRHHPLHGETRDMIREMVAGQFKGRPDLAKLFTPDFSPGCRRPTPAIGLADALAQDNARVVTNEISHFTERGIQMTNGEHHEFDLIVCATGFDIAFSPHFKIIGKAGRTMHEEWEEQPNVYLSMATPNFPNLFFIAGPTGNWAQGSLMITHEIQAEYALQCAAKISAENLHSLAPKQDVTSQWRRHVDTWHQKNSVWAEDCPSWMKYKGKIQIWSGSMLHMIKTLRVPRFEDFDIVRRDGDMWAFMGDGRTLLEIRRERGEDVDMAPFVRRCDEPWVLE